MTALADPAPSTDVPAAPAAPAADTQAPAPGESSTPETKELEVVHEGKPVNAATSLIETAEAAKEGQPDPADPAKPTGDESDGEDQPQKDKKGRDANARIRELNDAKNAAEQELAETRATLSELLKSKNPEFDVDDAIANGKDPLEAKVEAIEHNNATEKLNNSILELNLSTVEDSYKVASEFPFMDGSNPNRTLEELEIAKEITFGWFQDADVQFEKDPETGEQYFTQAKEGLYDYTKRITRIGTLFAKQAEVQGQRNAEQQLASVEIPPSRAPSTDKSGDDESLSAEDYAKKHNLKVVGG